MQPQNRLLPSGSAILHLTGTKGEKRCKSPPSTSKLPPFRPVVCTCKTGYTGLCSAKCRPADLVCDPCMIRSLFVMRYLSWLGHPYGLFLHEWSDKLLGSAVDDKDEIQEGGPGCPQCGEPMALFDCPECHGAARPPSTREERGCPFCGGSGGVYVSICSCPLTCQPFSPLA